MRELIELPFKILLAVMPFVKERTFFKSGTCDMKLLTFKSACCCNESATLDLIVVMLLPMELITVVPTINWVDCAFEFGLN